MSTARPLASDTIEPSGMADTVGCALSDYASMQASA